MYVYIYIYILLGLFLARRLVFQKQYNNLKTAFRI